MCFWVLYALSKGKSWISFFRRIRLESDTQISRLCNGIYVNTPAQLELPGEAVDHALHSGDMVRAREMVLKHWLPVLHRGEVATVLRWLDALPENRDGSDPDVPLARCWAFFLSGQSSAIWPQLETANNAYERLVSEGSLSDVQQDLIAAQLAMMRSVQARSRGDHARSVAHAEEAARYLPTEWVEGIGTSWNMLAAAHAGAGDFDGAIDAYERGITLAHAEGNLVGHRRADCGESCRSHLVVIPPSFFHLLFQIVEIRTAQQ